MLESEKKQNFPQHLAIIMDGNRRWAKERGLPAFFGHNEGAKVVQKITKVVRERGIPYLTLYALSTENLKRSEDELKKLFSLLHDVEKYLKDFLDNDVRLHIIGDLDGIPSDTAQRLRALMEKTKNNQAMVLTLAINYGGRNEIVRAVNRILLETKKSPILEGEHITINEKIFTSYLDTDTLPDVDLVIRTSGAQRLSNYLPWQTVYAELYFTETKWPAFTEIDLDLALTWFANQKRNHGK